MNASPVDERAHTQAPSLFQRIAEQERAKKAAFRAQFIHSTRYEPIEIIGRGQWGTVFKARDLIATQATGNETYVAIKVPTLTELAEAQCKQRNLEIAQAFSNEHRFGTSPNILPALADFDSVGMPYVLMPLCEESLAKAIQRVERTHISSNQAPSKDAWIKGIAAGLNQLHTRYKRAHGDLKLDNILLDKEGVFLSDFGNATMASMPAWSVSPRDNMGCLHTRAPELFKEGSHPTYRSDVYAAGALIHRLVAGEYLFEDEFRTQDEAARFMQKIDEKRFNALVKEHTTELPKQYRALIQKAMQCNPERRHHTGAALEGAVEDALTRHTFVEQATATLKHAGLRIGLPVVVAGLSYGLGALHYSGPHTLPQGTSLKGHLYLPQPLNEPIVTFDTEHIPDLPKIQRSTMVDDRMIDRISLEETKGNRTEAYLVASYRRVFLSGGGMHADPATDFQARLYQDKSKLPIPGTLKGRDLIGNTLHQTIIESIRYGMEQAYHPTEKSVDLEDMCLITRLGPAVVAQAQRAVNSHRFTDYRNARDSAGKRIIPEQEVAFAQKWLAYIHDNL